MQDYATHISCVCLLVCLAFAYRNRLFMLYILHNVYRTNYTTHKNNCRTKLSRA